MKIYAERRRAFLAKHFLCQVELAENGFSHTTAPTIINGIWYAKMDDSPFLGVASHISRSEEVHHTRGRTGANFLDESTWMAVSRAAHRRVHQKPAWARAIGYLR